MTLTQFSAGTAFASQLTFQWSVSNGGQFPAQVEADCQNAAQAEVDQVNKILLAHNVPTDSIDVAWSVTSQNACSRPGGCPTDPMVCSISFLTTNKLVKITAEVTPTHYGKGQSALCAADRKGVDANPDVFIALDEQVGWFFNPGCETYYGQILF